MEGKEPEKMTVSEALAAGYTHCGDGEEYFAKIDKSLFEVEWAYEFRSQLFVAKKEGIKYQLSAGTVQGFFQNEFESQDEVYDDSLGDNIPEDVFQKIAEMINAYLTTTYYDITDIELIADETRCNIQ